MNLILENGYLKVPNNKFADYNVVIPYKNRTINTEIPVQIFRNLNKKTKGLKWFSIRQNKLTVAHTSAICIRDALFVVKDKVKVRIRYTKHKEFHAYIQGYYSTSGMGTSANKNDLPAIIEYNPYKDDSFTCKNLTIKPFYPKEARFVICNNEGVRAAYTHQ